MAVLLAPFIVVSVVFVLALLAASWLAGERRQKNAPLKDDREHVEATGGASKTTPPAAPPAPTPQPHIEKSSHGHGGGHHHEEKGLWPVLWFFLLAILIFGCFDLFFFHVFIKIPAFYVAGLQQDAKVRAAIHPTVTVPKPQPAEVVPADQVPQTQTIIAPAMTEQSTGLPFWSLAVLIPSGMQIHHVAVNPAAGGYDTQCFDSITNTWTEATFDDANQPVNCQNAVAERYRSTGTLAVDVPYYFSPIPRS
jgi:hypothetical protein